jgi:hypothetical protein
MRSWLGAAERRRIRATDSGQANTLRDISMVVDDSVSLEPVILALKEGAAHAEKPDIGNDERAQGTRHDDH